MSKVRTGIILLILVGIAATLGTLVLQRPLTDPENLERAYSPTTLRWLDAVGLTDVFHTWWFAALLALLGLNIVITSVERFPVVWRFFVRPYRRPEPHFLASLPTKKEIPIRSAQAGIAAAERAFRKFGYKSQRVGKAEETSLYVERYRFARLAPYVVHASLLLILGGGIVDAVLGYRGFIALERGQQTNQIRLATGETKTLPFVLRCDGAGEEDYADGSPRRWWSKLAVLERGWEVKRQEIEVNNPLVHRGVRFLQSSYGRSNQPEAIRLSAAPKRPSGKAREFVLRADQPFQLDADTEVRLAAFVPDFMLRDGQVESRSDQPNNPAVELLVDSKKAGRVKVWLFQRFPNFEHPNQAAYRFELRDFELGHFTGLQVSYEPGQWAVWAGCILMGIGLAMAFYFVHVRFWAVPVGDGRGRLMLWVGASASKNRDEVEQRFKKLVEEIEQNLEIESDARLGERALPPRADLRTVFSGGK